MSPFTQFLLSLVHLAIATYKQDKAEVLFAIIVSVYRLWRLF